MQFYTRYLPIFWLLSVRGLYQQKVIDSRETLVAWFGRHPFIEGSAGSRGQHINRSDCDLSMYIRITTELLMRAILMANKMFTLPYTLSVVGNTWLTLYY